MMATNAKLKVAVDTCRAHFTPVCTRGGPTGGSSRLALLANRPNAVGAGLKAKVYRARVFVDRGARHADFDLHHPAKQLEWHIPPDGRSAARHAPALRICR